MPLKVKVVGPRFACGATFAFTVKPIRGLLFAQLWLVVDNTTDPLPIVALAEEATSKVRPLPPSVSV